MKKVKIQTMLGDIVVRLYDETPIHRDNFVKLVEEGYYDGTLFHRVIKDFMIQGGDPDSKGAPAGKMLGIGGPDYTLEAEIKEGLFHKRGALAAARQGDARIGAVQDQLDGRSRVGIADHRDLGARILKQGQDVMGDHDRRDDSEENEQRIEHGNRPDFLEIIFAEE